MRENGDTLNFDQYKNGRQHGLQVFEGYEYLDENVSTEIKFRLFWKDGIVVNILNTNILYLKNNMKVISEEKYLEKNPIDENGRNQLGLYSNEMLRIDETGKTWIVIPYKLKNSQRFTKRLNRTKWKPKYP